LSVKPPRLLHVRSPLGLGLLRPPGAYVGFDVDGEAVAWCRRAYARHLQATFVHADLANGFYAPGGSAAAASYAFPVEDGWADVVISNGVLNLMPDKDAALQEMSRVLKPGGRLQIGDIQVQKAVPESAKRKIDLWTG